MKSMINFLFEVGMLKKTPRTGYQFLGSGQESVAEHSFRTAVIGYMLSLQEPSADSLKTTLMCLFHDIHEARTGDQNYVNKKYVHVDEDRAIEDMALVGSLLAMKSSLSLVNSTAENP
jgi:putative hydrolase of HD superfamily